jgi:hypothetical protein
MRRWSRATTRGRCGSELLVAEKKALGEDGAPQVLARHLHDLVVKALANLPADGRLGQQVELANRLVELLAAESPRAGIDGGDGVAAPAELLLALRERGAEKLGTGEVPRPSLPLRHSDLLVNGPRDLRVGAEIRKELGSADQVDLLVAFLKWSGLRVVRAELEAFARRRPGKLRILTTTYLGASDVEALDDLEALGAEIRVSYDSRRTRRHRSLGPRPGCFTAIAAFSTALVGSSNLSQAALPN